MSGARGPMTELDREERFLYEVARRWREPERVHFDEDLDLERAGEIAVRNRMARMLARLLHARGHPIPLPVAESAARLVGNATRMADYLARYLALAAEQGLETVVIKGFAISIEIFGDAAMRPGGDIDLLVRRPEVEAHLALLDGMGIGPYWPNLMDDRYYARHHLHQQRCTPDLEIWFEIHWALDHPLTTLTVDYDAVLDRCHDGTLLGQPVRALDLADRILLLVLHLTKHAVYLTSVLDRPDLARIILADGMLLYFVDIAEIVRVRGEQIDWDALVERARAWGAVETLGAVLQVCRRLLGSEIPPRVLDALPVRGPGTVPAAIMQRVADYELDTHLGRTPSRFWELMLVTNGAFILRPIRLVEIGSYCFPGDDYLARRYGRTGPLAAGAHLARAIGQYAWAGIDTLYFSIERYRRLKRLNRSASLFNRLDDDIEGEGGWGHITGGADDG